MLILIRITGMAMDIPTTVVAAFTSAAAGVAGATMEEAGVDTPTMAADTTAAGTTVVADTMAVVDFMAVAATAVVTVN